MTKGINGKQFEEVIGVNTIGTKTNPLCIKRAGTP